MQIIIPPKETFYNEQLPLHESLAGYTISGWLKTVCPLEGGMYSYYHGYPFPFPGHIFPQAAEANNMMKKFTLCGLYTVTTKEAVPSFLAFFLLPFKWKVKWFEKILWNYCRMGDYIYRQYYPKKQYYNHFSREFWDLIELFLRNIGISKDVSHRTGRIIASLFEWDDAYRFRLQDIFTECNKENLLNSPIKEIKRLINLYVSREAHKGEYSVSGKFVAGATFLTYALLIPKIRKAFKRTIEQIDFKKLSLDEADRFWALSRGDYNFEGRPFNDRFTEHSNRMIEYQLINGFDFSKFDWEALEKTKQSYVV